MSNDDDDKAPPGAFVTTSPAADTAASTSDAPLAAPVSDSITPDTKPTGVGGASASSESKLSPNDDKKAEEDTSPSDHESGRAENVVPEASGQSLSSDVRRDNAEEEAQAERGADAPEKGKRKAPPAGLMLQDVPPPQARKSIEVSRARGDCECELGGHASDGWALGLAGTVKAGAKRELGVWRYVCGAWAQAWPIMHSLVSGRIARHHRRNPTSPAASNFTLGSSLRRHLPPTLSHSPGDLPSPCHHPPSSLALWRQSERR